MSAPGRMLDGDGSQHRSTAGRVAIPPVSPGIWPSILFRMLWSRRQRSVAMPEADEPPKE